jgi:hypothetical protein
MLPDYYSAAITGRVHTLPFTVQHKLYSRAKIGKGSYLENGDIDLFSRIKLGGKWENWKWVVGRRKSSMQTRNTVLKVPGQAALFSLPFIFIFTFLDSLLQIARGGGIINTVLSVV